MKKYITVLYFILLMVSFLILNYFQNHIENDIYLIKSLRSTSYNYNKSVEPKKLNIDINKYPNAKKCIEISLKFKVDDFNKYGNLFQTDYINKGIRFEINQDSQTGTLLFPDENQNLTGIDVGKIVPYVFHNIKIVIWNNKIAVDFDGKIYNTFVSLGNFSIDNILIGQGFFPERFFNGEIKNINLKYCSKELSPKINKFIKITQKVIISLFILSLLLLIISKFNIKNILNKGIEKIKDIFGQTTSNKKFSCSIILLIFVFCTLLIYFHDRLIYQNIYSFKKSNISYDKNSSNQDLSNPKEFYVKNFDKPNLINKFEISFDFVINKYSQYANLFQTAEANNGVRVELDEQLHPVILWTDKEAANNFGSIVLPSMNKFLKTGEKYNFNIIFIKNKQLFTNLRTPEKTYKCLKNFDSMNFNPVIGHITVGKGFDDNRIFDGKISNLSIKYNVLKISPVRIIILVGVEILLLVLASLIFIPILREKLSKHEDNDKNSYLFTLNLILAYYPTFLYFHNLYEINLLEYLLVVLVICSAFSVLYIILKKILKNKTNPFLITLATYLFLAFGGIILYQDTVYNNKTVFIQYIGIFIFTYLSILVLLLLNKVSEQNTKVINFFAIFLSLSLILTQGTAVVTYISTMIKDNNNKIQATVPIQLNMPNVYILIPDAYPNANNTEKYMNFDNKQFIDFLKQKGFYIVDKSHSNYAFTFQSLPSIVNYSYLKDLNVPENIERAKYLSIVKPLYKNSKLFEFFKERGYEIFFLNSHSCLCKDPNNVDHIYLNNIFASSLSISQLILEKSIIKTSGFDENTNQYNEVKTCFNNLKNISLQNIKQPRLVFAHILAPHFPFVFDRNGNRVTNKTNTNVTEQDIVYTYINEPALKEQILYVNSQIEEVINNILEKDKKAVIFITSDHSLHLTFEGKRTNSQGIKDDMKHAEQRFGNFMAIYTYDKTYDNYYSTMTPVTVLRTILNTYFGAELNIEADKIYLTSDSAIYNPEDITKKLIK
ncbi:sulfatase-like hydrolase/transferase [bacterium]|nr:sulfatase-like hydrolase/transferase [bacterium]